MPAILSRYLGIYASTVLLEPPHPPNSSFPIFQYFRLFFHSGVESMYLSHSVFSAGVAVRTLQVMYGSAFISLHISKYSAVPTPFTISPPGRLALGPMPSFQW